MRGLFFEKWLFCQYRPKHFLRCPIEKVISVLRVTLSCDRVRAARGEAGQRWSLLLLEASEVTGDRMPSHLLAAAAVYTQSLSPESGSRTWQSCGACAAWPAAGHFMVWRCGQRLLGVKRSTLHFKLLCLKLSQVVDACQVFTAEWGVSHFVWRHFKVISPASDLLTLSWSVQDCFCFHCRQKGSRECRGSLLHLISSSQFLKCKLLLWAASWSGGIPVTGSSLLSAHPVEADV